MMSRLIVLKPQRKQSGAVEEESLLAVIILHTQVGL